MYPNHQHFISSALGLANVTCIREALLKLSLKMKFLKKKYFMVEVKQQRHRFCRGFVMFLNLALEVFRLFHYL